jgi:hypothetical protein
MQKKWWALGLLLAFVSVTLLVALRHEVWRDEVRALNVAAGSHSLVELFRNMRDEGHPALWYLLLYAAYHLTGSMLVLKPVSLAIAWGAAWIWLRHSPLPLHQRALFLFGQLPLYEYSVMCRNYGLGMLLVFVACVFWRERFRRPVRLAVVLALLANSSAPALIVTVGLVLVLLVDGLLRRPPPAERVHAAVFAAALGIVIVGGVLSVAVLYPGKDNVVTGVQTLNAGAVARSLGQLLASPGQLFAAHVGLTSALCASVLVWLLVLSYAARPGLALALLVVFVGISMLHSLIYTLMLRHFGLALVFIVVAAWIDLESRDQLSLPQPLARVIAGLVRYREAALTLFLIGQVCLAVPMVQRDVEVALSSSEQLGRVLATPELREAIVISEPALIEALPYYARNPIYLPREHDYLKTRVSMTRTTQVVLSLDDLMALADRLHGETGKTIVLALSHRMDPAGPYSLWVSYRRSFVFTADSLKRFRERAQLVADLRAPAGDENFMVYRWK